MTLFTRMNTNKDESGKSWWKISFIQTDQQLFLIFFLAQLSWNGTHTGLWHIKRSKGYINATFKNQMKASRMTVSEDITVLWFLPTLEYSTSSEDSIFQLSDAAHVISRTLTSRFTTLMLHSTKLPLTCKWPLAGINYYFFGWSTPLNGGGEQKPKYDALTFLLILLLWRTAGIMGAHKP